MKNMEARLNLKLEDELLRRVDEFWHNQRCKNRSEAIRELLQIALASYEQCSVTIDAVQHETDEVYSDQ